MQIALAEHTAKYSHYMWAPDASSHHRYKVYHIPAHHQWLIIHYQRISGDRARNPLAGASSAQTRAEAAAALAPMN